MVSKCDHVFHVVDVETILGMSEVSAQVVLNHHLPYFADTGFQRYLVVWSRRHQEEPVVCNHLFQDWGKLRGCSRSFCWLLCVTAEIGRNCQVERIQGGLTR